MIRMLFFIKYFIFLLFGFTILIPSCKTSFNNIENKDENISESSLYYNHYEISFIDTLKLNPVDRISKIYNSNHTFKTTPDGCVSYFADGNYIIKDCGEKGKTKSKVLPHSNTLLLSNYSWIDNDRIVFSFHPTYMASLHDLMIFVYNMKTHEKEITYNFDGSGFLHTKLKNLDSNITNQFYLDKSNGIYASPIYIEQDSSIIVSVNPAYYKRSIENGFSKEDLLNTEALIRIFPISLNKKAERLNVKYKDIINNCTQNRSLNKSGFDIATLYDVQNNKILISSDFSSQIVEFDLKRNSSKLLVDNNCMLPECNNSLGEYDDDSKRVEYIYAGIFYDSINKKYFRQVCMPRFYKDSFKAKNLTYGLLIFDINFKCEGFSILPMHHKVIDCKDGKIIMLNRDFESYEEDFQIVYGQLGDPTIKNMPVILPDNYLNPLFSVNYSKYIKELGLMSNKYDEVFFFPIDNSCPSCVNRALGFLDITDSIAPSKAIVIIINNKLTYKKVIDKIDFSKFKGHVYFDINKKYQNYISTPSAFYKVSLKENEGNTTKTYNPDNIVGMFKELNNSYIEFGPTCNILD